METYFDWLVRHEKLVVAVVLLLVLALFVQLKFCKRVEPDIDYTQVQTPEKSSESVVNVAGKWEMSVPNKKGVQTWLLTLRQNGASLKGVITSEGGDLPVSGTVNGQDVELSANRFGMTIKFPATVQDDTMKGKMQVLTVNREWTAQRKQ
jgi:hypothetical protein